jgi:hypothetical protein
MLPQRIGDTGIQYQRYDCGMDHFYNLIELIILNKYDLCNPKQASHFPLNTFLVIFQIWSQIE